MLDNKPLIDDTSLDLLYILFKTIFFFLIYKIVEVGNVFMLLVIYKLVISEGHDTTSFLVCGLDFQVMLD